MKQWYALYVSLYSYDVIKWKRFPRYWPFVWGIHMSSVNSPHRGQWRGALMFSLLCAWINAWENNREAGDLRGNRAYYDVIMIYIVYVWYKITCSLWVIHESNLTNNYDTINSIIHTMTISSKSINRFNIIIFFYLFLGNAVFACNGIVCKR